MMLNHETGLLSTVTTAHAVAGAPACTAFRSSQCSRVCVNRRASALAAAEAVAALDDKHTDAVLVHCPNAAPRLLGNTGDVPAEVSIAHVNGRAVAAAAPRGCRIGVDIERAGSVADHELRLFCSAVESATGVAATTLWTLKEAAWKALGCTRETPFHSLELVFTGRGLVAVRLHGREWLAASRVWTPWRGWVAAVVEVAGVAVAA